MCLTLTLRSTRCKHEYIFKPLGNCARPRPNQACHKSVVHTEMQSPCRDCVIAKITRWERELDATLKQYAAYERQKWLSEDWVLAPRPDEDDELTKDESTKDEPTKDEPTKDEPTKDEPTKDEEAAQKCQPLPTVAITANGLALSIYVCATIFNDSLATFLTDIRKVFDGYDDGGKQPVPGRPVFRPSYGRDGIPGLVPPKDYRVAVERVRDSHGLVKGNYLELSKVDGDDW
ncbi:MAG: hypothetical protein M1826_000314 [Phylliscum demangeonii]|nr:MAG: hypothetical protein M1826_000314 [Phylliscum demangeonii]